MQGKIKFDKWLGIGSVNTISNHIHTFQLKKSGVILGEKLSQWLEVRYLREIVGKVKSPELTGIFIPRFSLACIVY